MVVSKPVALEIQGIALLGISGRPTLDSDSFACQKPSNYKFNKV